MTPATSQTLVSVIIPIYNVEQWLPACLASVAAQTFENFEALLVIDGASDGSQAIAERFAARDPRFSVLVTPNGGPGAARNHGLDRAVGDFVYFIDGDDTISRDALASLVAAQRLSGARLVAGAGEDVFPDGRRARYWTHRNQQFDQPMATYTLDEMPSLLDDHVVWAKLIDRRLLEHTRFPVGVHCEDIPVALRLELDAERITVVPEPKYEHQRHDQAISHDYLRDRTLTDWIDQAANTVRILTEDGRADLLRHYVGKHTLRQWWTRAENFAIFGDVDVLRRFEGLSGVLLEALESTGGVDELSPLTARTLRFFAAGLGSRYFADLGEASFLRRPGPQVALEAARAGLAAIAALELPQHLDAALERAFAAELITARVLHPVAVGFVTDAEARDLLADADVAIEQIGPVAFADLARAPLGDENLPATPEARTARARLDALGARAATVHHVRTDHRGTVLRGEVDLAGADPSQARYLARVRLLNGSGEVAAGQAGEGSPGSVVATWAEPSPERADLLRWQAVVPSDVARRGFALTLEVDRPYVPRAEFRVVLAAGATLPEGTSVVAEAPLVLGPAEQRHPRRMPPRPPT